MADLSVSVSVAPTLLPDTTLDPGDNVTITDDRQQCFGPDAAPDTKVEVNLPEGLTYSSHRSGHRNLPDRWSGIRPG